MDSRPLRGVNLGGWLVLEEWITPSLFQDTSAIDEYTFCEQATAAQLQCLKQFRDTFITKQDFEWLAAQGINAVRLPVGHWLFGGAPYQPTATYVDRALQWAEETGIQLIIDLHGAPGSQNGRDHSGRAGSVSWHRGAAQIIETLDVLRAVAERYGEHPALLGISLLNEPSGDIPKATLLDFYQKAYALIHSLCGGDVWVVYSDGYAASRWRKELPAGQFKNIYIDTHHYQVFSPIDKQAPWLHLLRTRFYLPFVLARFRRHHPVIVGEWSLTLGSSRLRSRSTEDRRRITASYGQLQLRAFQATAAWFFWTYRTETGGTWSFRDCVEKGLL